MYNNTDIENLSNLPGIPMSSRTLPPRGFLRFGVGATHVGAAASSLCISSICSLDIKCSTTLGLVFNFQSVNEIYRNLI